jgi:hypothetical protein
VLELWYVQAAWCRPFTPVDDLTKFPSLGRSPAGGGATDSAIARLVRADAPREPQEKACRELLSPISWQFMLLLTSAASGLYSSMLTYTYNGTTEYPQVPISYARRQGHLEETVRRRGVGFEKHRAT